jgi:hypothetical protein
VIKRLWLVLSIAWALAFIGNGLTKEAGIQNVDVFLALFPLIAGAIAWRLGRFVVTGR